MCVCVAGDILKVGSKLEIDDVTVVGIASKIKLLVVLRKPQCCEGTGISNVFRSPLHAFAFIYIVYDYTFDATVRETPD